MARDRSDRWDDEPIGDYDTGLRRRWRRPWNNYLAVLLGFFGVFMLLGSFLDPGLHTVGAVLVLAATWAVVRSDGRRARSGAPPPLPPDLREELTWVGVAVALVVVGAVLFSR